MQTNFNGSSGTVDFQVVQPNPTTFSRVGTIQLGEQIYTVTQSGGACGYSLNAYSALFGPPAASANILASPTALGCTPVPGTDQPTFIFLQPLQGPVGNIFTLPFDIAPFTSISPAVRKANVTLSGQIFVVKQTSY